ncbi:SAM-dependent methyltransferase [Rhodoblastus sphagnicola]|uniref:50S ribosomal protein L11 methyltransferase n=1 Tax=Rhodoblastus sphagnicola TaxID=333368 RepID=UPI001304E48A|nr:50S ribosomal protein L11 methyltransferase [Rhodoblastus sphagnicola]MBB4199754.1 SAM-dependent methyltransferase [Rhodoblastus sphagnicola]
MTDLETSASLSLDIAAYLDIDKPRHLRPRVKIDVADRAWRPPVEDRQRDWVSSIVAPALKILRARRGEAACKAFCALGTGVGLDALAAVELLGAEVVGVTDLFPDVVEAAAENIRRNLAPNSSVALHAGAGDLLQPLRGSGVKFDLIYENLPNLPLADGAKVEADSTSATFLAPRDESVPQAARDALLALHYVALVQAHEFLRPGGAVLSTIGARVPLSALTDMAEAAGYVARFLGYWWKAQVDPEAIVGSYAQWRRQGLGPFHFYEVDVLEAAFAGLELEQAGRDALSIEQALRPHQLDAEAALAGLRQGRRIGHTVAALLSEPNR